MQFVLKPDTEILTEERLIAPNKHKQISALEKEMRG